jgi:hypothetical protein
MSTLCHDPYPSKYPQSPLEDSAPPLPQLPMPNALPDDYEEPTVYHDPHAYVIDDLDRMPVPIDPG